MPARSDAADDRRRLVFLHGFTQTHHHWHRCAHLLADRLDDRPTLAFVDLPGHGLSSDDDLGIVSAATPLVDLTGRGAYVGYSMGGRFALLAALTGRPEVERLVLIGATAGADDPSGCADRLRADGERADRLERIGVDAFLEEWLAAPLFATLPAERRGLEHRRRNTVTGLAQSLRWSGTGNMGSAVWDALPGIDVPVLLLAGELDAKFTAIGRRIEELIPGAMFAAIPGAGHAAHAEQPEATADLVAAWLNRAPGRR